MMRKYDPTPPTTRDTANTLLKQHCLPLDDSADSIWRVMTQEASLAEDVMRYGLERKKTRGREGDPINTVGLNAGLGSPKISQWLFSLQGKTL